jgi:STAS domain
VAVLTSGMAALVRARRHARRRGGALVLAAPQRQVRRVLALTQQAAAFSLHADVAEAIGSMAGFVPVAAVAAYHREMMRTAVSHTGQIAAREYLSRGSAVPSAGGLLAGTAAYNEKSGPWRTRTNITRVQMPGPGATFLCYYSFPDCRILEFDADHSAAGGGYLPGCRLTSRADEVSHHDILGPAYERGHFARSIGRVTHPV